MMWVFLVLQNYTFLPSLPYNTTYSNSIPIQYIRGEKGLFCSLMFFVIYLHQLGDARRSLLGGWTWWIQTIISKFYLSFSLKSGIFKETLKSASPWEEHWGRWRFLSETKEVRNSVKAHRNIKQCSWDRLACFAK